MPIPSYVEKGSFDFMPETWQAAKQEARSILVEVARRRDTISYSDLVARIKTIDLKANDHRLFAMLGQLAIAEHEAGRPLLPVIVVHKHGDQKPGPGFFQLARALDRTQRDNNAIWSDEIAAVQNCKSWD